VPDNHEVGSRAERFLLSPSQPEPLPPLDPQSVRMSLIQLGIPVQNVIGTGSNTIWAVTASQEQLDALRSRFGERLTIEREGDVFPQPQ
jgi:hypothetical protein